MALVSYNTKIEENLRSKAFSVLKSYGLTPSQAFRLFLNQISVTRQVPLSFDYQQPEPALSAETAGRLRTSIQEIASGEYSQSSLEDFIKQFGNV